jgi:hypothetical protein
MQVIPLQATPNQAVQVQLGAQAAELRVYQAAYGLFVDVLLNGTLLLAGVVAENLNRIIRSDYLGFDGDLVFADTQGADDPVYTGLGSRFVLVWVTAADLTALGVTLA